MDARARSWNDAKQRSRERRLGYQTILYDEDGPVGTITLNRPDDGNMFNATMCHELRDCINAIRRETRTRVLVITGAGERFFCIGGRKDGLEDTILYAGTLPTLEVYESIERLQKPVIASVNGFAVGGGNVLQMLCDLTIAKESAVFRQVGPMMGSFDAGYGTWYLEDLVGKKKARSLPRPSPRSESPTRRNSAGKDAAVPDPPSPRGGAVLLRRRPVAGGYVLFAALPPCRRASAGTGPARQPASADLVRDTGVGRRRCRRSRRASARGRRPRVDLAFQPHRGRHRLSGLLAPGLCLQSVLAPGLHAVRSRAAHRLFEGERLDHRAERSRARGSRRGACAGKLAQARLHAAGFSRARARDRRGDLGS